MNFDGYYGSMGMLQRWRRQKKQHEHKHKRVAHKSRLCGKLPPSAKARRLLFGEALTNSLPPPPTSFDYSRKVTNWGWMGNDQYSDCTTAAAGHMVQTWTANWGAEKTISDADILTAFYATQANSAGADLITVLAYWKTTGVGGDTIIDYTGLVLSNRDVIKSCIYSLGGCYKYEQAMVRLDSTHEALAKAGQEAELHGTKILAMVEQHQVELSKVRDLLAAERGHAHSLALTVARLETKLELMTISKRNRRISLTKAKSS